MTGALAVMAAAAAVWCWLPDRARPGRVPGTAGSGLPVSVGIPADPGPVRRWRPAWALLAGAGAAAFVGGVAALPAGCLVAVGVWQLAGRVEPRDVRRRREEARRDLPHVVTLFGAALRSGAAPARRSIWCVVRCRELRRNC